MQGDNTSRFASMLGGLQDQEPIITDDSTQAPVDDTTNAPMDDTTQAAADDTGEEQDQAVIDFLRTTYGIEDTLENDVTGIQALIDKVAATKATQGIQELYDKRPIIKQLNDHIEAGKSIETFFQVQQVTSNKIELPPLTGDDKADAQNKQYYKDVITANYKAAGVSDKQIARIIESSEIENTLFDDAKEAADAWNSRVEVEAQRITQEEEAQLEAAKQAQVKMVTDISNLVDKGELNGSLIPQAERAEFKKFLLDLDDTGMAQRDKMISSLPLDKMLLIDYLLFKNFNIKGLQAAPSKVQALGTVRNNPMGNNAAPDGDNASKTQRLPTGLGSMNFRQLSETQTI